MSEERVRLVLDVAGVADVKQLENEIAQLLNALGATDARFQKLGESGKTAAKSVDDLAEAAGRARGSKGSGGKGGGGAGGGGGGFNGAGLLSLAQAFDDLQYGFGGVVNNIPSILIGLGMGPGLAGVAQVAAIFLNQVSDKLMNLIAGEPEYETTLKNLADTTSLWAGRLEFAKEQLEKLGKTQDLSLEGLEKYRKKLAEVSSLEKQVAEDRRNEAAGEKAVADPGVLEREKMESFRQAFQDQIVDTGESKNLQGFITSQFTRERLGGITGAKDNKELDTALLNYLVQNPELRKQYQDFIRDERLNNPEMSPRQASELYFTMNRERLKTTAISNETQRSKDEAERLIGRMANPSTSTDWLEAFDELRQIAPDIANRVAQQFQWSRQDKVFDEALEKFKASNQERRRRVAEFERNVQGPGMDMDAGQRDRANASVKELAGFEANRDERVRREKESVRSDAERNVAARIGLDASFKRANQMLEQTGSNPMFLYADAVNSGRTAQQKQQAIAQQTNMLSAQFQQQGISRADADVVAREIMKQGEQAVIAQRNQGNMFVNAFGQVAWNARYTQQQVQAIMRQMNLGVRPPSAQFGLRAR